jgi:tetratricopeptide (TPR) repeat protein
VRQLKPTIIGTVAIVALLATVDLAARAGAVEWEKLLNEAQSAAQSKDYDKAVKLYGDAADECLSSKLEDKFLAKTYNDLALVYEAQGKYADAEANLNKALAIKEKLGEKGDFSMPATLGNLAQIYRRQGKFDLAKVQYERAIAIVEKNSSASDA